MSNQSPQPHKFLPFAFWLPTVAVAYSFLHFLAQGPFQPVRMLSASEHYYLSQQIASGALLYRDFAYNKTPLTIYLGSLCFIFSRNQLIPSIILVRFVFWGLFAVSAWPVYIIAKETLKKNILAWISVFLYLGFPFVSHHLAGEPDWHVLMTAFGLLAIGFAIKKRFLLSGIFASLAFFSWQPGLIFLMAILFAEISLRQVGKLSKMKSLRPEARNFSNATRNTVLGFLGVATLFLTYFMIRGNLKDFFDLVFISTQNNVRSDFLKGFEYIPKYGRMCYSAYNFVMLAAIGGFFIHGFSFFRIKRSSLPQSAELALFSVTALTLIYSLVDFQHCDDFLVFIPWIALYSVYPIKYCLALPSRFAGKFLAVFLLVFLLSSFLKTFTSPIRTIQWLRANPPSRELTGQRHSLVTALQSYGFKKSDDILCIETALACLLTEKKNIYNKYVYVFDNYYTRYILQHDQASLQTLRAALDLQKPKFVFTMNTLWQRYGTKGLGLELKTLIEKNYELREDGRLFIYVRKESR